jgi:alpha-D-ribose 1-methylphosphonate 5-triphosphate synthase subunit PhnI
MSRIPVGVRVVVRHDCQSVDFGDSRFQRRLRKGDEGEVMSNCHLRRRGDGRSVDAVCVRFGWYDVEIAEEDLQVIAQ